jgi:hypothetical protein
MLSLSINEVTAVSGDDSSHPVSHSPVITLTTDFGLADPYVGAMKGVILSSARP